MSTQKFWFLVSLFHGLWILLLLAELFVSVLRQVLSLKELSLLIWLLLLLMLPVFAFVTDFMPETKFPTCIFFFFLRARYSFSESIVDSIQHNVDLSTKCWVSLMQTSFKGYLKNSAPHSTNLFTLQTVFLISLHVAHKILSCVHFAYCCYYKLCIG